MRHSPAYLFLTLTLMVAAPPSGTLAAESRDAHTRCVVLAPPGDAASLSALAVEVQRMRDLGADAVTLVFAGGEGWPADVPREAVAGLRQGADHIVVGQWNGAGPPDWVRRLGKVVPSAMLEVAYWQDRGYRLTPFVGGSGTGGATARSRPRAGAEERGQDQAREGRSGLRFDW